MSRDYPDWLHPFKAAQARREFVGTIPLKQLAVSADLADPSDDDVIGFELVFGLDDQRQACVRVRVHGHVPLVCQRTLQIFRHPVDSESLVGMVDSEAAAEALPEDYEPLIVTEPRVRVAELISEELLLALPLVPRAPESEPAGDADEPVSSDTHRPFAVLAELTGKPDKQQD